MFFNGKNNVINTLWKTFEKKKKILPLLYNKTNKVNLSIDEDDGPAHIIDNAEVENIENETDKIIFHYEDKIDSTVIEMPIGIEEITYVGTKDYFINDEFIIKGIKNNSSEEQMIIEENCNVNTYELEIDLDGKIYYGPSNFASTPILQIQKINPQTNTINADVGYGEDFFINKRIYLDTNDIANSTWNKVQYGIGRINPDTYTPTHINNIILTLLAGHPKIEKITNNFIFDDCVITMRGHNNDNTYPSYNSFELTASNKPLRVPSNGVVEINNTYMGLYGFGDINYLGSLDFRQKDIEQIKIYGIHLEPHSEIKPRKKALFSNLNIKEFIHAGLTPMSWQALISTLTFENCNIGSVTTGVSELKIETKAFYRCNGDFINDFFNWNFEDINFIGPYPFKECTFQTLSSTNITKIRTYANNTYGEFVFGDCIELETVSFSKLTNLPKGTFAGCSKLRTIYLPKITQIGAQAFQNCNCLTGSNITFSTALTSIGASAFENCTNLTSLNFIKTSNSYSVTLENKAFKNCGFTSLTLYKRILTLKSNVFEGNLSLRSANIYNVSSMLDYNFSHCSSLVTFISSSLTTMGKYNFYNCVKLQNVTLPSLIVTISEGTFAKCSSLTGTNLFLSSNLTTIGISAFEDCTSLTDLSFLESTNDVTLYNYAFRYCTGLVNVILPNSVKTIAGGVFGFDIGIKTVLFPEVTIMNNYNFEDCIAMESFEAPKLIQMGTNTFHGCGSLKTVLMPLITSFGENTFLECSALETVDIASYAGTFPNTAFPDAAYNNFKEITNSKLTSMSGIVVANDFSLSNNQGLLNNFELASTGKVVINSLIDTTSTTISLANATDITINNLNEENTLGIVNLTLNENATALDINLKDTEPETMAAMITSNCTELRNYNYWTPLYLQSSTMVPFLSTGTYATPTATETYIELGEINEEGYMTGSIYTKYKNKVIYIPSTLEAEYLTQEYFSNLVPDVQHGYFTTQNTETGEWTDFVLVSTEKSTVKEDYGFGIITI